MGKLQVRCQEMETCKFCFSSTGKMAGLKGGVVLHVFFFFVGKAVND